MSEPSPSIASQMADAAKAFQQHCMGHPVRESLVVLNDDMLVFTYYNSLSPSEVALVRSPQGTARVQEFHKRIFYGSAHLLVKEIHRITGVEVKESNVAIEPSNDPEAEPLVSGTVVQAFRLAKKISTNAWNAGIPSRPH